MRHAQLSFLFETAIRADASLQDRWSIAQRWTEESRYERKNAADAETLLDAIDGPRGNIAMDKAALVSFDVANGQRVIDALKADGKTPDVALWAVLPEYEDWRLVIASQKLEGLSLLESYSAINSAMRKAGMTFLTEPTIVFGRMDDPFIEALRSTFSSAADTMGMRLGGQKFGNQYVEDAFVYCIR